MEALMTAAPTLGPHTYEPGVGHQREDAHPLDVFVIDPAELPPLCDEPEFAALLDRMVAEEAPRLFAIVQEYGERVDGRIAAWGMAFANHAEVVTVEHTQWMSLQAPENALRLFALGSHFRSRLVWFNPEAASVAEDCDDTSDTEARRGHPAMRREAKVGCSVRVARAEATAGPHVGP
jgi:hypothetical protein